MEDGGAAEAKRIHAAMARQEAAFVDAVQKIMKERGITQKTLAEKTGVGQPAVSMILSRKCRPQRGTVQKVAKALGVDAKRLWTE